MTNTNAHVWELKARFRLNAFGWRSQPAIQRLKQAVKEIRRAARKDPVLAADGAVWEAHEADQIPYVERLADFWGELCASKEAASAWADRLVGITRMALSPSKDHHGYFHGTSACFSALYRAERYRRLWTFSRSTPIGNTGYGP